MEGNFYISDKVITLPGRRNISYAEAYKKCPMEAQAYGRCVEAGQVNRSLAKNLCQKERVDLRSCVDGHLKGYIKSRSKE